MPDGRASAEPQRASHIIVVEDDEAVRESLSGYLQNAGFQVTPVRLASEMLDALRDHTPNAIILDLGMPPGEMDGIDALARLRATQAWAALPVVIVSAIGDILNPDVRKGLRVNAVLTKPFTREHVVKTLKRVLEAQSA